MWRVYNLHHTSVFTYSHTNTPLGQSERAYYLSYFINLHNARSLCHTRALYINICTQPTSTVILFLAKSDKVSINQNLNQPIRARAGSYLHHKYIWLGMFDTNDYPPSLAQNNTFSTTRVSRVTLDIPVEK